ncbi:MAG: hypothetical protein M1827_002118 [Pycnora praestabilis]|nr:MAG: hypothetical protein M1827_002118 [Pycnora praestabilis]
MEEPQLDAEEIAQETPAKDVFLAPSIYTSQIMSGTSYGHYSSVPELLAGEDNIQCVLGVDEAGRGPILGPMVYALLYLPLSAHRSLLAETHHFNDSKVLTPTVRSSLMESLCTPGTDLYRSCGWATKVMSARDISADMLKPGGKYSLNEQAMDATVELIKEVFNKGVNVKEIYIDTIGSPQAYQKKLERIFPTTQITVAKKADSLYPCVSAASVCAKVTRDAALEVCYQAYTLTATKPDHEPEVVADGWGSGYPSDKRCSTWMKRNMDPVFGWSTECRFSWLPAMDLLEGKGDGAKVQWPTREDTESMRVTDFFFTPATEQCEHGDGLTGWFGSRVLEIDL